MVTKAAGHGCFGIHVESRGANVESVYVMIGNLRLQEKRKDEKDETDLT
ncbi:hypothetical protein KW850_25685 [Bacillus sp. sid0103]|nr:hypothetical protein [Bacillus sp. sid0103]MBV7508612.1 hypothetical protein [Bacillus sp. sid0103]